MSATLSPDPIRETVREKYAEQAREVSAARCCEPGCCSTATADPVTSHLYSADEIATLPETAVAISLGCGNPTALAQLHPGETVLDLGSGGGIDVLLSARTGRADGLCLWRGHDRRDARARRARTRPRPARRTYSSSRHIEDIPLPDDTVDVVISNCVINLAGDKGRCCARRSGYSSRAAASPSPMSSSKVNCQLTSARHGGMGRVCRRGAGRTGIPPTAGRRRVHRCRDRGDARLRSHESSPTACAAASRRRAAVATRQAGTSPPTRDSTPAAGKWSAHSCGRGGRSKTCAKRAAAGGFLGRAFSPAAARYTPFHRLIRGMVHA